MCLPKTRCQPIPFVMFAPLGTPVRLAHAPVRVVGEYVGSPPLPYRNRLLAGVFTGSSIFKPDVLGLRTGHVQRAKRPDREGGWVWTVRSSLRDPVVVEGVSDLGDEVEGATVYARIFFLLDHLDAVGQHAARKTQTVSDRTDVLRKTGRIEKLLCHCRPLTRQSVQRLDVTMLNGSYLGLPVSLRRQKPIVLSTWPVGNRRAVDRIFRLQ